MVTQPTFRTDDFTRWGSGQGSNLAAVTIDLNFWNLFTAIEGLEADESSGVGIDFITLTGNQLFVHLTDHSVQGPFTVPSTVWNPRGPFAGDVSYQPLDVISENGALYIVNVQHISAATFNVFATDGAGHFLYTLLLEEPGNELPTGGVAGQKLIKQTGSPFVMEWTNDYVRACLFIPGQPTDAQLVMQWIVTDNVVLPSGLPHSAAFAKTPAPISVPCVFTLTSNGSVIGSFDFGTGASSPTVGFPADALLGPGDVIAMTAPSPQNTVLADISFSIVGILQPPS